MKIHIYKNCDGTYHVAINGTHGCEDSTCVDWTAVQELLAYIQCPKHMQK